MRNAVDRQSELCTTGSAGRRPDIRPHARLPGPTREGPGNQLLYGEERSCLKRLRGCHGGPVEVGLRLVPDVGGDDLAEQAAVLVTALEVDPAPAAGPARLVSCGGQRLPGQRDV